MSNELAKQLGIELKPFCVRTEYLTPQQAQDLLDRCVDLGVKAEECICDESTHIKHDYPDWYCKDTYEFVGVNGDNWTYVGDIPDHYGGNILTFQEMLDYLQLHEEGDRLVPNESRPAPDLDDVITTGVRVGEGYCFVADGKQSKVDEDGFTPWSGGEMPVKKGTMVHVKYKDGAESIVTAGLIEGEGGFIQKRGLYCAKEWSHNNSGASIVAYKVVEDVPVSSPVISVGRSSVFDDVEVGSSLERALQLILAVYNGDDVKLEIDTKYDGDNQVFLCARRLEEVVSYLTAGGTYTLKSEESSNKRKEEVEKLDKEIEELENALKQRKTKREEMNNERG